MPSTSYSRLTSPRFIKLCVANWLLHLYVFSMPALLDAGYRQSGAGHAPTGWAVLAFALGMVLPGPLGAWLMEQRSRKGVFLRAMLLLGLLPTWGYANLPLPVWGIALHGLQGVAFGIAQTALGTTLVNDLLPSNQRSQGDVRYAWAGRLGIPMGLVCGLLLANFVPLPAAFWWTLLPCAASFLLVAQTEIPVKAPVKVPLFTLDRFFWPGSWRLSLTLFAAPWLLGRLAGTESCGLFPCCAMVAGTLTAFLLQRLLCRFFSPTLSVSLCYILLLPALLWTSLGGEVQLLAGSFLIGLGVSEVSSRHLSCWVKQAEHCQRGTAQSTYMLSWRISFALGFAASASQAFALGLPDIILCLISLLVAITLKGFSK